MQWDLGPQGLATLLVMSLIFGVFTQLLFLHRASWWVGVIATAAFFVVGILISEVVFGWATEEDLQPNIDGLSFDEVVVTYFVWVPIALVARYLVGRRSSLPVAH